VNKHRWWDLYGEIRSSKYHLSSKLDQLYILYGPERLLADYAAFRYSPVCILLYSPTMLDHRCLLVKRRS